MTIHVFALCKNDYFIRSIEFYLNRNNIILTGVGTRHDRALDDFAACTPAPDVILLDAHWQPFQTSGPTLTRQFLPTISKRRFIKTSGNMAPMVIFSATRPAPTLSSAVYKTFTWGSTPSWPLNDGDDVNRLGG